MNHDLKLLAAIGLIAASTVTLPAQSYYATGEFNGWNPAANLMNDDGDGTYSLTVLVTNVAPGNYHNWKVTAGNWDNQWPPAYQDVRTKSDANGMNTFHFRPGVINDGWNPIANRVGYDDPGNMAWEIVGSFDDWGNDTNDVAARQMSTSGNGLWTVDYTFPVPGTNEFKFRSPGAWDHAIGALFGNTGDNAKVVTTTSNEMVTLQLDLPNGRWLAGEPAAAPTNQVEFIVDMQYPIHLLALDPSDVNGFDTNYEKVYVRGSWSDFTLSTNAQLFQVPGTTLYSNTVPVIGYTGATVEYKYWKDFGDGAYETPALSCGGNRMLELTGTSPQMAPLVFWSDRTTNDPTSEVTFSVDMSLQVAAGNFDPLTHHVFVPGSFNDWTTTAFQLTNNPTGPDSNVFRGVLTFEGPVGGCGYQYKFWTDSPLIANSGWEHDRPTASKNREFSLTSTNTVLALAYWDALTPCDALEAETEVTFSVDMAGATGTDTSVYDGTQTIFINGDFIVGGWWGWGSPGPTNYALTKNPTSDVHSITLAIPAASTLLLTYKYSIGGADNEAGFGVNHIRYIRSSAGSTNYTAPLDKWINTNPNAPSEETELGGLTASSDAPGSVRLEWVGLNCAMMQSTTNLNSGEWTDRFEARGVSATNLTSTADAEYFRMTR